MTKESAQKKRGRPRKRVLSGKRGPKRRKNRFSTPDYVRFSGVGGHKRQEFLSVRAWCKWWAVTRNKEARPFSKCTLCGVYLCLGPRRNCFNAYHNDIFDVEDSGSVDGEQQSEPFEPTDE